MLKSLRMALRFTAERCMWRIFVVETLPPGVNNTFSVYRKIPLYIKGRTVKTVAGFRCHQSLCSLTEFDRVEWSVRELAARRHNYFVPSTAKTLAASRRWNVWICRRSRRFQCTPDISAIDKRAFKHDLKSGCSGCRSISVFSTGAGSLAGKSTCSNS